MRRFEIVAITKYLDLQLMLGFIQGPGKWHPKDERTAE